MLFKFSKLEKNPIFLKQKKIKFLCVRWTITSKEAKQHKSKKNLNFSTLQIFFKKYTLCDWNFDISEKSLTSCLQSVFYRTQKCLLDQKLQNFAYPQFRPLCGVRFSKKSPITDNIFPVLGIWVFCWGKLQKAVSH